MIGKIILAVVAFVIFPLGWALGAWYFLRKKEKGFGGLLAGLGLLALILIMAIPSADSDSESVTAQQGANQAADTSKPAPTSTPAPVPVIVNLREILDLRDANEVAADARYIGMYVSMDGEISQIHENDLNIVPLGSDEFQMAGAECKFDKSQSTDLLELRKGQTVTIVGIIRDVNDFVYNELEINPCRFN